MQRHLLQDTEVKSCMLVRLRPNDFSGPEASSSGYMTNENMLLQLRVFLPDRDPAHVQNLMGSFRCHYLSRCQISLKSVH